MYDLQARSIPGAEKLEREDQSTIEEVQAAVEIFDAELSDDKEYASMGEEPTDRVKSLLENLDAVRCNEELGCRINEEI